MFAIIIGDSPDHIIKLNHIESILTHVSNTVTDQALLSISNDLNLSKDQIVQLSEWIRDMIDSLNQLSDSTVELSND